MISPFAFLTGTAPSGLSAELEFDISAGFNLRKTVAEDKHPGNQIVFVNCLRLCLVVDM